MPNIKVSALPAVTSLDGSEKLHVVQGGVSKQATVGEVAGYQRDHAGIYVVDGAHNQSIPNGTTPTKIVHFAQAGGGDSHADGMVANAANSRLVADRTGHYLVHYQLSITCGTNNVTWECYAFAGGARAPETGSVSKLATGADHQSIGGVGILELTQGDELDLRVTHNYGTAVNLNVNHASLVATFLHD